MKVFLAVALFHLIAFVHCKGVEKTTEFGVKGDNDIHIYSEFFSVYRPAVDRYQCVSFPPPGLVNYYNITYVRINDYNPYLADITKVEGEIGTGHISLKIRAPLLRRIEATVDIFGTFIGPCFKNENNNNGNNNGNANNEDEGNNAGNNNQPADNTEKPVYDIDIRAGGDDKGNQPTNSQ